MRPAKPSRFVTHQLRAVLDEALQPGEATPPRSPAVVTSELLDTDFSSLVTYQECGYKYKLRHVCGFKPHLARELGFGKLLHHVVELAREAAGGGVPHVSDADDVLARAFYFPFAGPVPAKLLRESIRKRVRRYLEEYGDELRRTIRPEVPFEVPVGHARVRGRIDLMLRANGGDRQVELIDFKTSENRPPSEMHVNQLRLYAAAAERGSVSSP